MLINLINTNINLWQRSIIQSFVAGVLYAISFGFIHEFDILMTILDALSSSIVFSLCSIALWNIFTYGMSDKMNYFQRSSILSLYAVICIVLVLGIEVIICISIDYSLDFELRMLPSKILFLSLLFYVFRLSYIHQRKMSENSAYDENKSKDEDDYLDETNHNDLVSVDKKEDNKSEEKEYKVIDHLSFKTGNRIKMVNVDELVLLKAEDDYVSFVTVDGHWLKKGTMKEFAASLPGDKFVRVHRSYIVNVDKIAKIECYGQKHQIQMNSGINLWISITGYKALREKLGL